MKKVIKGIFLPAMVLVGFLSACDKAPSAPSQSDPSATQTATAMATPEPTATITATPYPCSGADTFGNTGTVFSFGRPKNAINISRFYNADSATVSGFTVNIPDAVTNSGNVRVGVYSDNAGQPSALLGETEGAFCVPGANNINLASALTLQPGYYWFAVISDTDNMAFDYETLLTSSRYRQYSHTYGSLPASLPSYAYPDEPSDVLVYAHYTCP